MQSNRFQIQMLSAALLLITSYAAWGGPRSYPYQITATVAMVGDVAKQVAGEKAVVKVIMGAGVDPHLYKPSRDDVAAIMRSDVVLYSGLMLEGKMIDTLTKLGRNRPVYAVTDQLPANHLLADEAAKGHHDPHVWMDPSAWAKVVDRITGLLAEFDPSNAAQYRENAAAYVKQILALHEYGRVALGTIPANRRLLITSHDAFQYFGRAFGLEVMGIQGISTESETGLRRINQMVDLIVRRGVQAVFVESSVPRRNVEALVQGAKSRGHDLKVGGELFSDAMGMAGSYEGTYLGMLDHNITTVARALGGKAPERGWQGKLGNVVH